MADASRNRRIVAVLLAVSIGALLAASRCRAPSHVAPVQEVSSPLPVSPPEPSPVSLDQLLAPPAEVEPSPEDRARWQAIVAVAEAGTRYAVDCPRIHRDSSSFMSPEGAICSSLYCAVNEPAGTIPVQGDTAAGPGVVATLRWWTDAEGTHCVSEPPGAHPLRVRVVDEHGQPIAGATVMADPAAAQTDADGRATVVLPSPGTTLLTAYAPGSAYTFVQATPGEAVEIALAIAPERTEQEAFEGLMTHRVASWLANIEDLDAALEQTDLSPEVVAAVEEQLQSARFGLEIMCRSLPELPICAPDP